MIILSIILLFLEPLVVMVGWNKIVHPTFNISDLTYLQAFGLYMLFSLPSLNKSSFFFNTDRGFKLFINLTNRQSISSDAEKVLIRDADMTYMKYKLAVLIIGLAFFYFVF